MSKNKANTLQYKLWLGVCWIRSVFLSQTGEAIGNSVSRVTHFTKRLLFTLAILGVSLPIAYYALTPQSQMDVIASVAPSLPDSLEEEAIFSEAVNTVVVENAQEKADLIDKVKSVFPDNGKKNQTQAGEPVQVAVTNNKTFSISAETESVADKFDEKFQNRNVKNEPVQVAIQSSEKTASRTLIRKEDKERLFGAALKSDKDAKAVSQSMAKSESTKSASTSLSKSNSKKETALEHAKKHKDPMYVCPMHPQILEKKFGTCPICGMDLVPVEAAGEGGVVQLSPAVINALGVRTAKVKKRNLYRRIETVGYINYDENGIRNVSLRSDGWVERLVVKSVGEQVSKGDLLFELYSPKLVNAQEEFIQALNLGNRGLLEASAERLRALGISDRQILDLQKTKKTEQLVKVYAPQDGFVSVLNIREGQFVSKKSNVAAIVDLSSVWLKAEIFERQADWVELGQRAKISLPFRPDLNKDQQEKLANGVVEYVYPNLDPKTRSLQVRLRFDNPSELLKPNMYVDITIYAKPKRDVLAIPSEAIIRTGDEKRVIVSQDNGHFKPVKISTGIEAGGNTQIKSGLEEGETVVVSSQFLIDSESSIQASLLRMTE